MFLHFSWDMMSGALTFSIELVFEILLGGVVCAGETWNSWLCGRFCLQVLFVQLIESGEKERLKELLRERLIECGWRDELKAQCR